MKTSTFASVLVATLGCGPGDPPGEEKASTPGPSGAGEPGLACNLDGLTPAERAESQRLLQRIGTAIAELKDLPDGYAFRFDERQLPFADVSRWVDLERRCCPFFRFGIEVLPQGGTWLRLTGGPGVKDFIRSVVGVGGEAS